MSLSQKNKIPHMNINLKLEKVTFQEKCKDVDVFIGALNYKIRKLTQKKQHKLALIRSNKRDSMSITINVFHLKDIKKRRLCSHHIKDIGNFNISYNDQVPQEKFNPQQPILVKKYKMH